MSRLGIENLGVENLHGNPWHAYIVNNDGLANTKFNQRCFGVVYDRNTEKFRQCRNFRNAGEFTCRAHGNVDLCQRFKKEKCQGDRAIGKNTSKEFVVVKCQFVGSKCKQDVSVQNELRVPNDFYTFIKNEKKQYTSVFALLDFFNRLPNQTPRINPASEVIQVATPLPAPRSSSSAAPNRAPVPAPRKGVTSAQQLAAKRLQEQGYFSRQEEVAKPENWHAKISNTSRGKKWEGTIEQLDRYLKSSDSLFLRKELLQSVTVRNLDVLCSMNKLPYSNLTNCTQKDNKKFNKEDKVNNLLKFYNAVAV